jgi:AraC family transcriptional regulator
MGRIVTTERLLLPAIQSRLSPSRWAVVLSCADSWQRRSRFLFTVVQTVSVSLKGRSSRKSPTGFARIMGTSAKRGTIAMTTFPDVNESSLVHRDGVDRASGVVSRVEARDDAVSLRASMGFQPTVGITPIESIKRLGTGGQRWFSESIYASINKRVEFRFQGRVHLLVLYNEGARKDGETSIDDLQCSRLRNFSHKLTFVPAGCIYRESHETSASVRMTFLYLDPSVFLNADSVEDCFRPRIHFEDSFVWETASKLKNVIESSQTQCASYLGALSGVLGHELSRVNKEASAEPDVSRGGLAGWQKRTVVGYIEEHLSEPFCLLKLAQLAELSLHHFCRAFKQSFGIPAHQYQVYRRMEVAKLLLADRTTSVTDIALNLGYAQTSSFSSAFRKTTGWTPTTYRRKFK